MALVKAGSKTLKWKVELPTSSVSISKPLLLIAKMCGFEVKNNMEVFDDSLSFVLREYSTSEEAKNKFISLSHGINAEMAMLADDCHGIKSGTMSLMMPQVYKMYDLWLFLSTELSKMIRTTDWSQFYPTNIVYISGKGEEPHVVVDSNIDNVENFSSARFFPEFKGLTVYVDGDRQINRAFKVGNGETSDKVTVEVVRYLLNKYRIPKDGEISYHRQRVKFSFRDGILVLSLPCGWVLRMYEEDKVLFRELGIKSIQYTPKCPNIVDVSKTLPMISVDTASIVKGIFKTYCFPKSWEGLITDGKSADKRGQKL